MTERAFTFRRLGRRLPAVYAVESPADYLGNVEALSGRPGQSRSTNLYRAFPVTKRGYAAARPLPETFASRREAAEAILNHLHGATPDGLAEGHRDVTHSGASRRVGSAR